jgi:UDP-N-acetyl-2-amino-2-deoxyglucuronate dehydrogenase
MNQPTLPRLKLAVIGAGLGSAPHFRSLVDLADAVEVAWVLVRNLDRLQGVALPTGARATTRVEDVFHDPSVDAVLILTPPDTHLHFARLAATAGKHVLVEKPLEVNLALATDLVQTCEAAGVQLAVMLQHRLRPGARELGELQRTGALGDIVSAAAHIRWWRPQSYYDVPGRGTLARDGGGVLLTQAIHTLDLLLDLIGLPQRVTGSVSTSAVHRMQCEDTASALLHYPHGAVAVVHATTAASPGYPERIEINATGGTATLESGRLQLTYMDGRTETAGVDSGTGGGADPMAFDHGPHRAVILDFLNAVRDGRAPSVTGRSALAVQAVIEAIVASSEQGRALALNPDKA